MTHDTFSIIGSGDSALSYPKLTERLKCLTKYSLGIKKINK